MGMGLSICRSIIELHGGRIWAVPNLAHGATIQFLLPISQDTKVASECSDRIIDRRERMR
jgi:signal transduction histidine kinase